MRDKKRKYGFTLVELLIVICVIGILFVVIVSRVDFSTDKARTTGVQSDFRAFQTAAHQVAVEDGKLVENIDLLAERLNANLDGELYIYVENDTLKTDKTDPWGTYYQLSYSCPSDTKGQLTVVSAGPDLTFNTKDDISNSVICKIVSTGIDIVIRDNETGDEDVPDHVCSFVQQNMNEQYVKSPGNCKTPAIYYYSCICGIKGTNTFEGEINNNVHAAAIEDDYVMIDNTTHTKTSTCPACSSKVNEINEPHSVNNNQCICGYIAHTHSFVEIVRDDMIKNAATCILPAEYYYSCECGEKSTITFEYGSPLEHDFVGTITKYPSCTEKGIKTFACNRCTYSYTEELEKYAHSYTNKDVKDKYLNTTATCVDKATYYFSCICGLKGTDTFEWGDLNTNAHSQTTFNTYQYIDVQLHETQHRCDKCKNIINKVNESHVFDSSNSCTLCKQHVHVFNIENQNSLRKVPTCTTKATYFYECLCGEPGTEYYEFGTIDASNHTGIEVYGKIKEAHTKYDCCGAIISSQHECESTIVVAATCTTKGSTKYTCICEYEYIEQDIPTLEHVYSYSVMSDTTLKQSAHCKSAATYYYSCVCGAVGNTTFTNGDKDLSVHLGSEINGGTLKVHSKYSCCNATISSEHTYTTSIVSPSTCSTHGTIKYTCECGYSYTSKELPLGDCIFDEDGICPECGMDSRAGLYSDDGEKIYSWKELQNLGAIKSDHRAGTSQEDIDLLAGHLVLPEKLTNIGEYAFMDCVNLTKVTIGPNVTLIDRAAFSGCKKFFFDTNGMLPSDFIDIESVEQTAADEYTIVFDVSSDSFTEKQHIPAKLKIIFQSVHLESCDGKVIDK